MRSPYEAPPERPDRDGSPVRSCDWREEAACLPLSASSGYDWLPERGADYMAIMRAKEVCWEACPVRDVCAARGDREKFGIWGGINRDPEVELEARTRHVIAESISHERALEMAESRIRHERTRAALAGEEVPGHAGAFVAQVLLTLPGGTALGFEATEAEMRRFRRASRRWLDGCGEEDLRLAISRTEDFRLDGVAAWSATLAEGRGA